MTDLSTTLASEPLSGTLPVELPLGHLFAARHLGSMLGTGTLRPQMCKVFKKDLLYFSYGGLFYRQKDIPTENVTELPIGFVFSPRLLDEMATVYPFDTGAMHAKVFGAMWCKRLEPFETTFGVPTTDAGTVATQIVHHVYGTNEAYFHGSPSSSCKGKREPLPLLYEFLSEDLSSIKGDHRQRSIECIAETEINFGKYLEWVGFPRVPGRSSSDTLAKIYQWTKPDRPKHWAYKYTQNFNPYALAQALECKAQEDFTDRFFEFEP